MKDRLDLTLAIIATDHRPLRDLTRHLEQAGARLLKVEALTDAPAGAKGADVALLFADGYSLDQACDAVTQLAVRLTVVLTSNVGAFRPSLAERSKDYRLIVLSVLTWRWTLVEVIRRALSVRAGEA